MAPLLIKKLKLFDNLGLVILRLVIAVLPCLYGLYWLVAVTFLRLESWKFQLKTLINLRFLVKIIASSGYRHIVSACCSSSNAAILISCRKI